MIRLLAGLSLTLTLLVMEGCVVHPGHYDYPRYHYPRYHFPRFHYQTPPIQFRFHYFRGWRGMNQEFIPMESVLLVNYEDEPLMCVDPQYVEPDNG